MIIEMKHFNEYKTVRERSKQVRTVPSQFPLKNGPRIAVNPVFDGYFISEKNKKQRNENVMTIKFINLIRIQLLYSYFTIKF